MSRDLQHLLGVAAIIIALALLFNGFPHRCGCKKDDDE